MILRTPLPLVLAAGILLTICSGGLSSAARPDAVPLASLSTLYSFDAYDSNSQNTSGSSPLGLVGGPNGTFYGSAQSGGANGSGTLFKVQSDGTGFTVLHTFGSNDGFAGSLTVSADGSLYGTEPNGGINSSGAVFSMASDGSGFTALYTFSAADANGLNPDGVSPTGSLLEGSGGTLYGETQFGGPNGAGGVYRINANGSGFTVLHSFRSTASDGEYPTGGLIAGPDGTLYGVTEFGGINTSGTVFKLRPDGSGYAVLYQFADDSNQLVNADGAVPTAALTLGNDGLLYGTTVVGGAGGTGVLFRVGTDGTSFAVMHAFSQTDSQNTNADGAFPNAALVKDKAGNFYGATMSGGSLGLGAVFRLKADGSQFAAMYTLEGGDGTNPSLAEGSDGLIYGTTTDGGANATGSLFRVSLNGMTHLLWNNSSGLATVWTFSADGTVTSTVAYGPIADWTAHSVADAADGTVRLMWKSMSGAASVWDIGLDGTVTSTPAYGPYGDWQAQALAIGADNLTRLLWKNTAGSSTVWTISLDGTVTSTPAYGPYGDWQASALTVGPDNETRLLWKNTAGSCTIWAIGLDGKVTSTVPYGPYGDWQASALTVGSDNLARLLWKNTAGSSTVWTISLDGTVTSTPAYGPYGDWQAQALAIGADNLTRLLWKNTAGSSTVWTISLDGTVTSTPAYGPYGDWQAHALAAGN